MPQRETKPDLKEYRRTVTNGHIRHVWFVYNRAAKLGVHLWVQHAEAESPTNDNAYGGIELHMGERPSWGKEEPLTEHCPFTGARCWGDGTSLGAVPYVELFVRGMLDDDTAFRVVCGWLSDRAPEASEEGSGNGEA